VTGGSAGSGGHAKPIPAQNCYISVMGGSEGGPGSPLTFNPDTCYGPAPYLGSGLAAPTNLRIAS